MNNESENNQMPPIMTQAFSFIKAAGYAGYRFASTGKSLVPRKISDLRIRLCNECNVRIGSRCIHCGCNMPIKVHLFDSECKDGKWGKIKP